jgi:hypothetical protein
MTIRRLIVPLFATFAVGCGGSDPFSTDNPGGVDPSTGNVGEEGGSDSVTCTPGTTTTTVVMGESTCNETEFNNQDFGAAFACTTQVFETVADVTCTSSAEGPPDGCDIKVKQKTDKDEAQQVLNLTFTCHPQSELGKQKLEISIPLVPDLDHDGDDNDDQGAIHFAATQGDIRTFQGFFQWLSTPEGKAWLQTIANQNGAEKLNNIKFDYHPVVVASGNCPAGSTPFYRSLAGRTHYLNYNGTAGTSPTKVCPHPVSPVNDPWSWDAHPETLTGPCAMGAPGADPDLYAWSCTQAPHKYWRGRTGSARTSVPLIHQNIDCQAASTFLPDGTPVGFTASHRLGGFQTQRYSYVNGVSNLAGGQSCSNNSQCPTGQECFTSSATRSGDTWPSAAIEPSSPRPRHVQGNAPTRKCYDVPALVDYAETSEATASPPGAQVVNGNSQIEFHTLGDNGFALGATVYVTDMVDADGNAIAAYNQSFTITEIVDARTFRVTNTSGSQVVGGAGWIDSNKLAVLTGTGAMAILGRTPYTMDANGDRAIGHLVDPSGTGEVFVSEDIGCSPANF